MNLFLYLHPNFEAVFKGTSPGKTARKRDKKLRFRRNRISARTHRMPRRQCGTRSEKFKKGDEKVQKEGQKRFETASTREIKAAFPEKRRNSHSVMINSRFPSPDHKLVTGDPVQILLGNE